MVLPTSAQITNLFLYGQINTPNNLLSDSLIRIPNENIAVQNRASILVNTQEFMTVGGGRFAVGAQFSLVNLFFTSASTLAPRYNDGNPSTPDYYTKEEIAAIFGLANSNYGWDMYQSNYQDGTDDYAERTYIYQTQSFQIADGAKFIVMPDGTARIENFGIIPRTGVQENFDFDGGLLSNLVNPLIKPSIDPSGIGRTININYSGDVTRVTYEQANYWSDQTKISNWSGFNPIKLENDINSLIDNLWNSGVTKFLTPDGRPIIYGTDAGETINAGNVFLEELYPTLAPHASKGVVVIGGKGGDTFLESSNNDIFDGGEGVDTVRYEDTALFWGKEIIISERTSVPNTSPTNTSKEVDLIVNVERIEGSDAGDDLDVVLLTNTKVMHINAGGGDDTVSVVGSAVAFNPTIDLGAGDDVLKAAPRGSIVYGGAGADSFEIGSDYLIGDAEAIDKITYQGKQLFGGVTWKGQESAWAKGMYGIQYGYNSDNELVIKDLGGKDTYVAGFTDQLSGQTAGIRMGEMSLTSYRLFDAPKGAQIYESFEAIFGYYLKIMTGQSYFAGVDPLVLDLDGDGIELSARSSISPFYDIDADGFAEKSGWVRGDDAILVRDLNANGKIDNVSEMFGNATTTGFAAANDNWYTEYKLVA